MEYAKFQRLLREGENARVDFKIRCDAFASGTLGPKAELAKDICAMANNGNVASYILVGVSDDAQTFESVLNSKLTDDNLQDFCKKAISPPPQVKLLRKCWIKATPSHTGIEFVILQIGPQRRQAFRLAQDFISYKEKVCYRRNEVWLRRGATSDLATPEEVSRLVNGQSPQEINEEIQQARQKFTLASESERKRTIWATTLDILPEIGYLPLPEEHFVSRQRVCPAFWKRINATAFLLYVVGCSTSLTQMDLKWGPVIEVLDPCFAEWAELPTPITELTRRSIKSVRRIWLFSVLRPVPPSRVTQAFPSLRRTEIPYHYYMASLRQIGQSESKRDGLISTSSELVILDRIQSVPDFTESLIDTISALENNQAPVVGT